MVLSLLVVLALSGCGEDTSDSNAGVTAAGGTVKATTAAQAEKAPLLGTVEGQTYQNQNLGMTCTLPSSFVYSTKEELLAKNGLEAADVAALETMADHFQQVHLMYALDQEARTNILVTYQKATAETMAKVDLKADLQARLEGDIQAYEGMGVSGVQGEYTTVSVGGKTLDAVLLSGVYQDRSLLSMTVQYKQETGLVTLTLNGHSRQSLDQLLSAISLT